MIAINNVNYSNNAFGNSLSFSHTISSRENKLLIVGVSMRTTGQYLHATYNNKDMVELSSASHTFLKCSLFYMLQEDLPTDGLAHDVIVTVTADGFIPSSIGTLAMVMDIYNAKQVLSCFSYNTDDLPEHDETISLDTSSLGNKIILLDYFGNNSYVKTDYDHSQTLQYTDNITSESDLVAISTSRTIRNNAGNYSLTYTDVTNAYGHIFLAIEDEPVTNNHLSILNFR